MRFNSDLLLLSTLCTMWKLCSTVVLCALLRLQQENRMSRMTRKRARGAGSPLLAWTSVTLPSNMLRSRHCKSA